MNEYNDKGERHGLWVVYYYKGNLYFKGNFVNGKKHGICEQYNTNGELNIKQYYL